MNQIYKNQAGEWGRFLGKSVCCMYNRLKRITLLFSLVLYFKLLVFNTLSFGSPYSSINRL